METAVTAEVTKPEPEPRLYATGHTFLEPLSCGSTISYRIYGTKWGLDADISLTDCNRKIDWDFSEKIALDKIDEAINLLTQFRRDYKNAQRQFKKDFPKE